MSAQTSHKQIAKNTFFLKSAIISSSKVFVLIKYVGIGLTPNTQINNKNQPKNDLYLARIHPKNSLI